MQDAEWRRRERAWLVEPDDAVTLEAAVADRRRRGERVPRAMRERQVRPPRTFDTNLPLRVFARLAASDGAPVLVGRTGESGAPVQLPASRTWWVQPIPVTGMRVVDADMAALVGVLAHERVPGVSLEGAHITDVALERLATVEHLTHLVLRNCQRVTDAGLAALASLSHLESLDLSGCRLVTDAGVARLAALRELAALGLSSCTDVTDDGLGALGPLELVQLRIESCQVTDAGLEQLAAASPDLVDLDLAGCRHVSDRGVRAVARLPRLHKLDLVGCGRITDASLIELAARATGLGSLAVGPAGSTSRRITDVGVRQLGALRELSWLKLDSCEGVSEGGLEALGSLPRLAGLDLGGCTLVDDRALARLAGHPRLARLGLWRCDLVTDAGLAHLARVANLVELELQWCGAVTDAGLAHLHALSNLRRLNVAGCDGVSVGGRALLMQSLPACAVE